MSVSLELRAVGVMLQKKPVLKGISFRLSSGELLALVGPNGAGKTTLLRAALGALPVQSGQVLLNGRDLHSYSYRERAAWLGFLPQQLASPESIPVCEVVQTGRFRFQESQASSQKAAEAALERVGLSSFGSALLTELSGGERQRVAMATLLAQEVRLALLDEPASHLDPAQQIDTYRLISDLRSAGLGVLLVTHDVNLLAQIEQPERARIFGVSQGQRAFELSVTHERLRLALSELFGVLFEEVFVQGRRMLLATERTLGNPA